MLNFCRTRSIEDAARTYPADDPLGAVQTILARSDQVVHHWAITAAALGFLTDSYHLFASNVILPAISYVYWQQDSAGYVNAFNIATLLGTIVGQLGFGWLADRFGRRATYGYEILVVVVSIFGLLQSSQGFRSGDGPSSEYTWSITPWLFFWRIVMGIAIGAGYPISATIAAEFSPTQSRARTMSVVFLMQPLGQALACFVGLAAISLLGSSLVDIDRFWRIVVGIGAVPAILALVTQLLLPESWRYSWYVVRNPRQALLRLKLGSMASLPLRNHQLVNTLRRYSESTISTRYSRNSHEFQAENPFSDSSGIYSPQWFTSSGYDLEAERSRHTMSAYGNETEADIDWTGEELLPRGLSNLRTFLMNENATNLKRLIGVSLSWFLLDYAFYGMGFMSPATLAKLWEPTNLYFSYDAPWWQVTADVSNITISPDIEVVNGVYANGTIAYATINDVLGNNVIHILLTTSTAAVVGGLFFTLVLAERVNRRQLLMWTYLGLAATFIAFVIALPYSFHHGPDEDNGFNGPNLLIALWALAQFLYGIGPNTLTFILPAEIFPTRYRSTCYGIAAATGKLGAVLVQAIMWKAANGPNDYSTLRSLMGSFAAAMFLGAILAWLPGPFAHRLPRLITETQVRRTGIDDDVSTSKCEAGAQNRDHRKRDRLWFIRMHSVQNLSLENCTDDKRYLPTMLR